jgi:hypothetical protein
LWWASSSIFSRNAGSRRPCAFGRAIFGNQATHGETASFVLNSGQSSQNCVEASWTANGNCRKQRAT